MTMQRADRARHVANDNGDGHWIKRWWRSPLVDAEAHIIYMLSPAALFTVFVIGPALLALAAFVLAVL